MHLSRVVVAVVLLLGCFSAGAEPTTGTFVVQISPFASEVPLKPKIEAQLKTGGVEWGLQGDQMVVSMVNKRFVDFDLNQMTRYGSQQTLQLAPGTYRLTTLGFEPRTAFSVEKALAKSAYVNENMVSFEVIAGKTTTMKIDPIIVDKDATLFLDYFIPTLFVSVSTDHGNGTIEETTPAATAVAINLRGDKSVAWPAYHGKLKFAAK